MEIENNDKYDPFTSIMTAETMSDLLANNKKFEEMLDVFRGYTFDHVTYHIREKYGASMLMMYTNTAIEKAPMSIKRTLHVAFCVDSDYLSLAKAMVVTTYKRFSETIDANPTMFDKKDSAFVEDLVVCDDEILNVIKNIWEEEENDDNREEGKII